VVAYFNKRYPPNPNRHHRLQRLNCISSTIIVETQFRNIVNACAAYRSARSGIYRHRHRHRVSSGPRDYRCASWIEDVQKSIWPPRMEVGQDRRRGRAWSSSGSSAWCFHLPFPARAGRGRGCPLRVPCPRDSMYQLGTSFDHSMDDVRGCGNVHQSMLQMTLTPECT
jgi:hypothetical protein